MKKFLPVTSIVFLLLLGLSLLFYPDVSNCLAQRNANVAMQAYSQDIAAMNAKALQAEWDWVLKYNDSLPGKVKQAPFSQAQATESEDYPSILSINGIIGTIDIPRINIFLPVFHGTGEDALKKGAGHLENTALPIGRTGDHTVLTGHRGLPAAKLFTDLDKLEIGDLFYLNVLNRKFSYEIDQIIVVEPDDTEPLLPAPDKSYVSLVTCTPYAINSHRLIVRGIHVSTAAIEDNTETEAAFGPAEDGNRRIAIFLAAAGAVFTAFTALQWLLKRRKGAGRL